MNIKKNSRSYNNLSNKKDTQNFREALYNIIIVLLKKDNIVFKIWSNFLRIKQI